MKNAVFYFILIIGFLTSGMISAQGKQRQMEALDRGLVAVKTDSGVFISWRLLGNERDAAFNVYKNGKLFKSLSAGEATNLTDNSGKPSDKYVVRTIVNSKETSSSKEVTPWAEEFLTIQMNRPQGGTTPPGVTYVRAKHPPVVQEYPEGQAYTYVPGDCSVGDLDGDGEYEIIVKWNPSNQADNSFSGVTGPVYLDAYKLNGKQLWRIDLGKNIRAGSHYTQFMVYDFDGDGKAELVCKTAPGTIDGKGKKIFLGTDDPEKDWRNLEMNHKTCGYILEGPEYLTIFSGETGEELHTIPYEVERGEVSSWGDSYGNRVDRFLACVAYLDGVHPSVVMCRGYYAKTTLVAYDFINGKLVKRWKHISDVKGEGAFGQGNHNLRVGDVDGDGCDEIIYGSCAIDHNGKGLYTTKMGHGDAIHLTHFDPSRKGLQVWDCHENKRDGSTYRDAATGEVIFQIKDNTDVGRCMAADIDPTQPGVEMWSVASGGIRNVKGEVVKDRVRGLSCNMAVWWDGDLLRELLDRNMVSKYNWEKGVCERIAIFEGTLSNNGTKANPCLQGDIVGDWREEVLMRTADNTALRLYVSTIPTDYRFHTFLEDPIYRISIATQNVAYNQPTQSGFYFGPELQGTVFRGCKIPKK